MSQHADRRLSRQAGPLLRFVRENWFYALALVVLWRFPYIVADLTGSEVMPRRPTGDSVFWQSVMAQTLLLACLAMSYNLLFGFAGIISFGHALYFGIGGYATFLLINEYQPGARWPVIIGVAALVFALGALAKIPWGRLAAVAVAVAVLLFFLLPGGGSPSVYQGIGVAILVSIALSLLSGAVTLRLRGVYFAMFTLALAEVFWVLAKSGTFHYLTGAEDGLPFRDIIPDVLNPTPTADGNRLQMYRVTVIFFAVVFLAIRRYVNSPVGRVIISTRENEQRARAIGYNVFHYKLLTMVFGGVLATLSGILFVLWSADKTVNPGLLSMNYTVEPLLTTLIGGLGTLTGPVVATLGLELGRIYLREETFTLGTQLFGLVTIWQTLWMAGFALFFYVFRRGLRRVVTQVVGDPRRASVAVGALVIVVLVIVALVAQAIYAETDLDATVYKVADLWQLFQGLMFVVAVMLLPHGIVGTWNRWWYARRLRREERAAAALAARAAPPAPAAPLAEVERPGERA
jgi:branched-chain amino acid transport system permease protein